MASLSDEQILEKISSPRNTSNIQLARLQEERLLLHSESILEKYNLPFWAWRNFEKWWQSLVTIEKYSKIENLITTPLSTNHIVEDIFRQISKWRDAQDRYVSFNFASVDFTNDFSDYLDKTNDDYFWRDECLEALKTRICDIVVIDLPAIQTSSRPEPYRYFVSPSMMIDIDINKFNGNIEYFIFRQSKYKWDSELNNSSVASQFNSLFQGKEVQKLIALDDDFYRTYVKGEGSDWKLISKIAHNLKYCPAIDFWKPSIQGTNGINKKGILTNLLSMLDKYLFYSALVSYMDIYGAFPIFVTYAMEEEMPDDKRKEVNFGDYYNPSTTSYIANGNNQGTVQNPRVSYRWMGAPGSIIEYPQPADSSDANFVKDSPHFINMPVEALKHVNDRCASLRNEIIQYATGENKEYMNEIAKNQEMMDASFNKQDSILTFVKRQLERVHRFDIKTQAILRYGEEFFISCTVDYGSDYFLKDAGKIVEEYEAAVDAGMPPEYCTQIAIEASKTRFKNNPDILARQRIFRDVLPYQNYSIEDLVLIGANISDVENFVIRINSDNFISQFELDYGDIVKFGSTISYSNKIKFIKAQFINYGKQINWKVIEPGGTGKSGAGGAGTSTS